MRIYESIWNQLKQKKKISITANKAFHARILKAVIKEKYNDIGYKLTLAESDNRKAILFHECRTSIIIFRLEFFPPFPITLEDI